MRRLFWAFGFFPCILFISLTSTVSSSVAPSDSTSRAKRNSPTLGQCPASSVATRVIICRPRNDCPSNRVLSSRRSCRLSPNQMLGQSSETSESEHIFSRGGYEGVCCRVDAAQVDPARNLTDIVEAKNDMSNHRTDGGAVVEESRLRGTTLNMSSLLDVFIYATMANSERAAPEATNEQVAALNLADLGIDCGKRDLRYKMMRVGRIVGGEPAGFSDWPWMVMLMNYGKPRCGAALISRNTIITAAHCVSGNMLLYNLTARIGMFNMNERQGLLFPPVLIQVDRIIRHPLFELATLLNDVAILLLKEPVNYAPNIQPVCLASQEYPIGQQTFILGWGKEEENNTVYELPDSLQSVAIPIISRTKCGQYFASQGLATLIGSQHLCAGTDGGGKDACQGDSGGPMLVENADGRFELTGVISWGFGCGEPNVPGVYANIFHYKQWIIDTVKNLESLRVSTTTPTLTTSIPTLATHHPDSERNHAENQI